jgi:two-component system cell cycle response regulator DivK
VRLGSEDGLEVARWIRSREDLRDVPILALTADATPGAPERALAAGCNAYLAKPVGGRDVLARIHDLLAERAYAVVGPPRR